MSTSLPERFIEALHRLESDRDVDGIAGLFTEDADVGNVATTKTYEGQEGAREFWRGYREAFDDVSSDFRTTLGTEGKAALEWTTTATLAGGDPLRYDGVSLLEYDDDGIRRFRAYFDPRPITRQLDPS